MGYVLTVDVPLNPQNVGVPQPAVQLGAIDEIVTLPTAIPNPSACVRLRGDLVCYSRHGKGYCGRELSALCRVLTCELSRWNGHKVRSWCDGADTTLKPCTLCPRKRTLNECCFQKASTKGLLLEPCDTCA